MRVSGVHSMVGFFFSVSFIDFNPEHLKEAKKTVVGWRSLWGASDVSLCIRTLGSETLPLPIYQHEPDRAFDSINPIALSLNFPHLSQSQDTRVKIDS
ncbi:MAG: hypothetical protein RLZZ338_2045 [Cyanobacteriota bacterium]|jgi:hypothetical protein